MPKRGRPKNSNESRAEQLRRSQRKRREHDRAAGLVTLQLKVPAATAERLRIAARSSDFPERLRELLDESVIGTADYPGLAQITWNRNEPFISARDAFGLYERNWRLLDQGRLSDAERALIDRLSTRFGGGIIHA